MSNNVLYLIIAALAAAVIVLGYLYWDASRTRGVSLQVDERGVSIQTN